MNSFINTKISYITSFKDYFIIGLLLLLREVKYPSSMLLTEPKEGAQYIPVG